MKKFFDVVKPFWSPLDLKDKLSKNWHWRNARLDETAFKQPKNTETMIEQIEHRERTQLKD